MVHMRWYVVLAIVLGVIGVTVFVLTYMIFAAQGLQLIPYVAVIKLRGTISYSKTGLFTPTITSDDVRYLVNKVLSDPQAKAVVVVINSPGGSASASEEIYELLSKLSKHKPVIAYCEDVMASGGYYIALPAKKIVASPHCMTGSIGAIAIFFDIHNLLEKLGINVTTVKSGEYKDIGSSFRSLKSDELRIIGDIVNKTAQIFRERVMMCRPNVDQSVFNAQIFIAEDALRYGLIDYIGTFDDAVEIARELGGLPPTAPIREITKPKSILELLLGLASLNHGELVKPLLKPGVYYLWTGGLNVNLEILSDYLMIH